MKQIHSFDELRQIKDTKVYALGTFDGIHLGHQRVIRKAVEEAASVNGVSIIITFEDHPLTILHPERVPKRLIQEDIMNAVIESLQVDYILRLPMTEALLNMRADEFLDALCKDTNVEAIVVGENFTFGAKGLGNPEYMKQVLADKAIQVLVQPLLPCDELSTPISSTEIRKAIREGRLEDATHWLGRPFQFKGTVIKGDQRGRTLGFPTLNLLLPNEMATPPDGVYANRVCIDGIWYDGVGNVGDNPTFKNQYHRCEVHVFDFDQDIYGKEVIVQFISYLRGEVKFNNLQDLIDQMKVDEEQALAILANAQ